MATPILTVDGTYGPVTRTGTGASIATPSAGSKPLVDADVVLSVVVGGVVGTDPVAVTYSLDGGITTSATQALTGTPPHTLAIAGTGISFDFTIAAAVVGDAYACRTRAGFRQLTLMTPVEVDAIETSFPGYLANILRGRSAEILAALRKRYAGSADQSQPFIDMSHPPDAVIRWLTDIATLDAYLKRGFNPGSTQDQLVADAAKRAWDQVKEASDSQNGLLDLPLAESKPGASGITLGGPYSSGDQDPYSWMDQQREAVRGR